MELLYRLGPIKVNTEPKSKPKRILIFAKFYGSLISGMHKVILRQLCYLACQCFDHNAGP